MVNLIFRVDYIYLPCGLTKLPSQSCGFAKLQSPPYEVQSQLMQVGKWQNCPLQKLHLPPSKFVQITKKDTYSLTWVQFDFWIANYIRKSLIVIQEKIKPKLK